MMFEEKGHINSKNNHKKYMPIPKVDYIVSENEQKQEFDEIFAIVKTMITNLTNYDFVMEEKTLYALRKSIMMPCCPQICFQFQKT
jgi:hypothetical protein